MNGYKGQAVGWSYTAFFYQVSSNQLKFTLKEMFPASESNELSTLVLYQFLKIYPIFNLSNILGMNFLTFFSLEFLIALSGVHYLPFPYVLSVTLKIISFFILSFFFPW